MGKVICTKCKKFVDYSIEYKQEKTTIKEKEVTYLKAEAHCKECGAIVWVEEVEKQNILAYTNQSSELASDTQKAYKDGYKKGLNSKLTSDFVMVAQKIAVEKFAEKLKKRSYCDNVFMDGKWHRYVFVDEIDELLKEYENERGSK